MPALEDRDDDGACLFAHRREMMLHAVRLKPRAGIPPFPTSARSVSGKKSTNGTRRETDRIVRNQKIALSEKNQNQNEMR